MKIIIWNSKTMSHDISHCWIQENQDFDNSLKKIIDWLFLIETCIIVINNLRRDYRSIRVDVNLFHVWKKLIMYIFNCARYKMRITMFLISITLNFISKTRSSMIMKILTALNKNCVLFNWNSSKTFNIIKKNCTSYRRVLCCISVWKNDIRSVLCLCWKIKNKISKKELMIQGSCV